MSKVCQLFSGSSGNSIFISCGKAKLLVDAGVTAKRLEEGLSAIGENAAELNAIFVTHEHSDHIAGLRVLASRYKIPVFSSEAVLKRMLKEDKINDKVTAYPISENMQINSVEIIPFSLSHDSVSCHGYRFNLPDGRSVCVCTDTGIVTQAARKVIPGSDLVFLESNHEIRMLENGPYPYILKQRILSKNGHLSNADCAEFAKELVSSGTTRLVLAHLSRENNFPEIARQTTLAALDQAGFRENYDFRLRVSAPVNTERPIII